MKTFRYLLFSSLLLLSLCAPKKQAIRLNQIQVVGSHNSYKLAIDPALLRLVLSRDTTAIGLDYYHLPIREQLDLGLRGLEIDVSHDPTGGRYQYPKGIEWAKQAGIRLPVHDSLHILSEPGMKVLHVSDIDFKSSCLTFKACLNEVKLWSQDHPDHLPIFITINTKDSGLSEPGATAVLPFTAPVLDSLDVEILSIFPNEKLITPSLVRGVAPTLKEGVTKNGWPTLDAVRGRIMFILDSSDTITSTYAVHGIDRPMFVNVPENNDLAAFMILNEPQKQKDEITSMLAKGYMVRTRSDSETMEARAGIYTRWEAAQSSGAQLISTDYYTAKLSPTGKFQISFSDGKYARCNPVTLAEPCKEALK